MGIAEFLLARIAEDEAVARAATPGPWEWEPETEGCGSIGAVGDVGIHVSDEDAEHIARWDPARVLAECDAKRRIVNECGWVTVMQLLALPYTDHPAYDESWRP